MSALFDFDPALLHYADDESDASFYLQPPSAARVSMPQILTPAGREFYLDTEPSVFDGAGDEFVYQSVFTSNDNDEFKKRLQMFRAIAQWHSVPCDSYRDFFLLTLLSASPDEFTWQGRAIGGFRFAFPVQFHAMPNGFAFLVHQEVFRVEVADEHNPTKAEEIPQSIRARNERCGFRMPSTLAVVSQLQSDSEAFKEQINLVHENTESGANSTLIAAEYGISQNYAKRLMNEAFETKRISDPKHLNSEDVAAFRQWKSSIPTRRKMSD